MDADYPDRRADAATGGELAATPALELLPGVTSFAAATVGLFAFGLFARDGYYVIAGYIGMVAVPVGGLLLLQAAVA